MADTVKVVCRKIQSVLLFTMTHVVTKSSQFRICSFFELLCRHTQSHTQTDASRNNTLPARMIRRLVLLLITHLSLIILMTTNWQWRM